MKCKGFPEHLVSERGNVKQIGIIILLLMKRYWIAELLLNSELLISGNNCMDILDK